MVTRRYYILQGERCKNLTHVNKWEDVRIVLSWKLFLPVVYEYNLTEKKQRSKERVIENSIDIELNIMYYVVHGLYYYDMYMGMYSV